MAAESKLERECRDFVVHALQGELVKLTSPGSNGFPDRVMLLPRGRIAFVEFKAPGAKLKKNQHRWAKRLVYLGVESWTIDDFEQFARMATSLYKERGSQDARRDTRRS